VEKSLVKTLLGIYHGRLTYPSTQALIAAGAATTISTTAPAARTA
jgi:hypothetical protein